jgi:hypothetical protein
MSPSRDKNWRGPPAMAATLVYSGRKSMATFETVLRDARTLTKEEREFLIIQMNWTLEDDQALDESDLIAEL